MDVFPTFQIMLLFLFFFILIVIAQPLMRGCAITNVKNQNTKTKNKNKSMIWKVGNISILFGNTNISEKDQSIGQVFRHFLIYNIKNFKDVMCQKS